MLVQVHETGREEKETSMRTLLVILLGLPAGLGGNARQDGTWQKYENGNWQAAQTPQSERARAQTAKSPPAPCSLGRRGLRANLLTHSAEKGWGRRSMHGSGTRPFVGG